MCICVSCLWYCAWGGCVNFKKHWRSLWAWKRKQWSQRPLLNHLTSGKTKRNFKSHPNAPGLLHLPGIYHPLPGGLITPCPKPPTTCSTTNAISSKEYPKRPAWLTFPLIASTNLPLNMKPPWSVLHAAWSLGRLSPLRAWIKVTYFSWGRLSSFSASARTVPSIFHVPASNWPCHSMVITRVWVRATMTESFCIMGMSVALVLSLLPWVGRVGLSQQCGWVLPGLYEMSALTALQRCCEDEIKWWAGTMCHISIAF